MVDWNSIDTVLLDMDGTLLDLHFDDYFWLEMVPARYARKHGLTPEAARDRLLARYREIEGTLNWYSVDFWSQELGIDIPLLKAEVEHLIAVFPNVEEFLLRLRRHGKYLALVTNAHGKSLALKMRKTELGRYLDAIVCAHDLGVPKEEQPFWEKLRSIIEFDPAKTLLIDDSLPVLRSARQWGIAYQLTIRQPNRRRPAREITEFPVIGDFSEIWPDE